MRRVSFYVNVTETTVSQFLVLEKHMSVLLHYYSYSAVHNATSVALLSASGLKTAIELRVVAKCALEPRLASVMMVQ